MSLNFECRANKAVVMYKENKSIKPPTSGLQWELQRTTTFDTIAADC